MLRGCVGKQPLILMRPGQSNTQSEDSKALRCTAQKCLIKWLGVFESCSEVSRLNVQSLVNFEVQHLDESLKDSEEQLSSVSDQVAQETRGLL